MDQYSVEDELAATGNDHIRGRKWAPGQDTSSPSLPASLSPLRFCRTSAPEFPYSALYLYSRFSHRRNLVIFKSVFLIYFPSDDGLLVHCPTNDSGLEDECH